MALTLSNPDTSMTQPEPAPVSAGITDIFADLRKTLGAIPEGARPRDSVSAVDKVSASHGYTSREREEVADDEIQVIKKRKLRKADADTEQVEQLGIRCYIEDYNKFVEYAASRRISYKVAFAEIMAMVPDAPKR